MSDEKIDTSTGTPPTQTNETASPTPSAVGQGDPTKKPSK